MARDTATTEKLRRLLAQLQELTENRTLHWERQVDSAHRYCRWNNNLLILGPDAPLSDVSVSRYLFITPFNSPDCIEVNSDDAELGKAVLQLAQAVEVVSKDEPPTDPFAVTAEILERLNT